MTKLCTLPLLAGENVSHAFVVPTVAASIDLVVHIACAMRPGSAGCARSSRCPAGSKGDVIETADMFTTRDDRLVRAEGWPPHLDRFARAGCDVAALLNDASRTPARGSMVAG